MNTLITFLGIFGTLSLAQASDHIARANSVEAIAAGTIFKLSKDIRLDYNPGPFEYEPPYRLRAQSVFVGGYRLDETPELPFEPVTHCVLKIYSKNNDAHWVVAGTTFKIVGDGKTTRSHRNSFAPGRPRSIVWNVDSKNVDGTLSCEASMVSFKLTTRMIDRTLGDELPVVRLQLK